MKLKNKLLMGSTLLLIHSSVFLPSQYSPRYTLLANEIHVEVGSDAKMDPTAYLLRNRQPLNEKDKEKFVIKDDSDISEIGDYQIVYDDTHILKVVVEDTTAPTLSLTSLSVKKGDPFAWNESAYASIIQGISDNYTETATLEKNLHCEDVDTSIEGTKDIACQVQDESGNLASTKIQVEVQGVEVKEPVKTPQTTSVASMQQTINIPSASYSSQEIAQIQQVAAIVNQIRLENGLSPVSLDMGNYHNVTYLRSQEVLSVYSHTRPNGQACYSIFGEYGLGYSSSGENIAQGQQSAEEVVNDWMNSPTHRANILRGEFTILTVGVAGNGAHKIWVQEFFS